MVTLRTEASEAEYQRVRAERRGSSACPLCDISPTKEFTHWRIVPNQYPYDRIADTHDMIVSKRHVQEQDITEEEWREYKEIARDFIHPTYEYIIEPTLKTKSIPDHFHIHLITAKP